uniref:Uncharacterized protein n=1 Tax=Pristionchus pacificus TaxID=54126 RepID=A0A2A6CYZ0_PRIPA
NDDSWSWTDTTYTNRSIVLCPSTSVRLAPVQSQTTESLGGYETSDDFSHSVSSLSFMDPHSDPPSYESDESSSNASLEFNPGDHLMVRKCGY